MKGTLVNDTIVKQFSSKLHDFSKKWNYSKPVIRSSDYKTKIYIIKKHAIQIEIDWMECSVYMYVVYLKNQELPADDIIYNYSDGQWCRCFFEDIYKIKHPNVKDKKKRYTAENIYYCYDFFAQLMEKDPNTLLRFIELIDET